MAEEKGGEEDSCAGWESIHPDLLSLIFARLPLPDLIRSAVVCKFWRQSAAKSHHQRPKLPCLWLGESRSERAPSTYSLSDECFYNLIVPKRLMVVDGPYQDSSGDESYEDWYVDSSGDESYEDWYVHGSFEDWLVLVCISDREGNHSCSYAFYNPFSAAQIKLPPMNYLSLVGIRLSSSPQSPGCVAAVIAMSSARCGIFAQFCNASEGANASWGNPIQCDQLSCYQDAIFYRESFFTINAKGTLYVADTESAEFKVSITSPSESSLTHSCHNALMVSGGELLMRSSRKHGPVMVYKANFELATWEVAESLMGQALFSPFWSMPPASSYGIEGDCVYFVQDLNKFDSFRVSDKRWRKNCFDKKYTSSDAWALFNERGRYFMLIPKPNFCLEQ